MAQDHFQTPPDPQKGCKNQKMIPKTPLKYLPSTAPVVGRQVTEFVSPSNAYLSRVFVSNFPARM